MKKLALLLLTLASFGTAAFAADIAVSGKLTTWAGFDTNATDFDSDTSDSVGYIYANGELNTAVELSDNVKVVLELELNDKVSNGNSRNSFAPGGRATVEIDEAYVQIGEFLTENLSLKIGHQWYENSLRNNHRAMVLGTDMTALKGTYKFEKGFLDVFYGKIQESLLTPKASTDIEAYGVYGEFNVNENIHVIGYVNNIFGDNGALGAGAHNAYGVSVGAGVDWFLLDKKLELFLEVAGQFGKVNDNVNHSAFGVDLGAAWNFGELGSIKGLSVELNFGFRTGDDPASGDSKEFQTYAARSGALIAEASYNLTGTHDDNPMYKGYVTQGYTAIRLEVAAQWTDKIGSSFLFGYFDNNDDNADPFGFEVDLSTTYKYSENLFFAGHIGAFFPDDGLAPNGDSMFALAFETTVTF